MGVLGLWQLLAPVGQPVTLESLENKTLAVDISIWLNQAIKGYRDATGGSVGNAHLLSLFSRLCKLLYYKIRPIIVFDGGVPELKKQTVINRQQRRNALKQSCQNTGLKVLANYMAAQGLDADKASTSLGINPVLAKKPAVSEDIFILPPLQENSESEDHDNFPEPKSFANHDILTKHDLQYLSQIDIESEEFQTLPPELKQEILSTLKENRKHRHWSYYENLPEECDEFSNYQMQCLLKRRRIQSKLDAVHLDIQKKHCTDIVALYGSNDEIYGEPSKIMSDDVSHYVLLKKIIVPKSLPTLQSQESKIEEKKFINTDEVKNPEKKYQTILEESYSSDDLDDSMNEFHDSMNEFRDSMNKFHDLVDDFKISTTIETNAVKANTKFKILGQEGSSSEQLTVMEETEKSETKKTVQGHEELNNIMSFICKETKISQSKLAALKPEDEILCKPVHAPKNELIVEKEPEAVSNDNSQYVATIESSDDGSLHSVPEIETGLVLDKFVEIKNNLNDILNNSSSKYDGLYEDNKSTYVDDACPSDVISLNEPPFSVNEISTNNSSMKDTEKLTELRENLQKEFEEASVLLQAEQAKQQRQANTVQEHMVQECKDLLKLFGVPYIVSPMEAEAQCAFYDLHELTHGTITDDSDIWLFGGKRVYKNFFAQKKYVEFYQEKEIASHFNLNRAKLICFAMLTGSDYTEGIENVGPVTAMEILSEFVGDGVETLSKFKQWWEEFNTCSSAPKNKVRAKLQKLSVGDSFPNHVVFETYLNPEVDDSTESFSWGLPDLDAIRDYTKEKFGWNKDKVDDMLLPVIKRLNERTTQTHLDSFFTVHLKKEKNLFPSKRITSALKKINPSKNYNDDAMNAKPNTSKRTSRSNCVKVTKREKQKLKNSKKSDVSKANEQSKIMKVVQLSDESSCDDPSE